MGSLFSILTSLVMLFPQKKEGSRARFFAICIALHVAKVLRMSNTIEHMVFSQSGQKHCGGEGQQCMVVISGQERQLKTLDLDCVLLVRFELPLADLLPEEYRDAADEYEKGRFLPSFRA